MANQKSDDQYSEKETAQRRDAALNRALSMPLNRLPPTPLSV
jgi:hypothetical protein